MINLDSEVKRLGSDKDYATGRTGTVIELSTVVPDGIQKFAVPRARVKWHHDRHGNPMKDIRTWVRIEDLREL